MDVPQPSMPKTLRVTSPAFAEGDHIPTRFTCRGREISPAFAWVGVPADAVGVAVVVSDPDAPRGTYLHWLVTGLAPSDAGFAEGAAPAGSREWPSSAGTPGWIGPCPPSGTHRYIFAVHALDALVDGSTSQEVLAWIGAHTIAWGALTGLVKH